MKYKFFLGILLISQFLHAQIGITQIGIVNIAISDTIGVVDTVGIESHPTGGLCNRLLPCFIGLPVTMLPLVANRVNKQTVQLIWETTSEINNAGFNIERSFNLPNHFENIIFVQSAGSTLNSKKYTLNDANDFAGKTFYRLKQIDKDGQYKYSNIAVVQGLSNKASAFIYPNPTNQWVNISLSDLVLNKQLEMQLMDMNGKVLSAIKIQPNVANFYVFKLDASLPKGYYFLKIITANNTFVEKIMKD